MKDKGNVMRAIEDCVFHKIDCVDCDYDGCVFKHGDCKMDLLADALELMEEQDAVKPKSKSRHGEYPQIVHRCGNCNEILYRYYKYCPTCGRSVKWDDS